LLKVFYNFAKNKSLWEKETSKPEEVKFLEGLLVKPDPNPPKRKSFKASKAKSG